MGGDAKVAREEASRFEDDYVAEVEGRRDVLGELTKQLRQQFLSSAAGLKALAAVHVDLESHKTKTDSPDEALKVTQKDIAVMEGLVEKLRA